MRNRRFALSMAGPRRIGRFIEDEQVPLLVWFANGHSRTFLRDCVVSLLNAQLRKGESRGIMGLKKSPERAQVEQST